MRSLLLLLTFGCTTTRPLADLADPRLRMPGHATPFVLDHERVHPNTLFQFGDAHGRWTQSVAGAELRIDSAGAWTDRFVFPWTVADAVRIEGMPDSAAALVEHARPKSAVLERDGEAYVLSAPRPVLQRWLLELELAVARLQPEEVVTIPGTRVILQEDDAKLYQLREIDRGASLGTWSLSSRGGPWQAPIRGVALVDFLHRGRKLRVGWKWDEIAHAEVANINGPKTLGGLVLGSVTIVGFMAMAPLLEHWPFWSDKSRDASWDADLAPASSDATPRLFSTGARVRAIIRPVVTLDAAAALSRDLVSSGVSARIRFMELFEIGGGARETVASGHRQTTGMFQAGFHVPLDAASHFAIPLGIDVGHGGEVAVDLRVPWGLRLTTGNWLATILPASPEMLHLHDQARRWSVTSGIELGRTF